MVSPQAKRHRGGNPALYWCFTAFQDDEPEYDAECMSYLVYQREVSPDTGREHWQGYVELKRKMRFAQVQEMLCCPNAHMEVRRGKAQQASEYCKKQESRKPGTEPKEFGVINNPPSNDFEVVAAEILKGRALEDVALEFPKHYIKFHGGLGKLAAIVERRREHTFRKPRVLVFHGKTGTGKSRYAYEMAAHEYGSYFRKTYADGTDWWDGYYNEKCIIVDDYNGETPITNLLRLLDGYGHNELRQVKGGFTRLKNMECVIFTSNKKWQDWYPMALDEHKAALERRITSTREFNEPVRYIPVKQEPIEYIELD